MRLNLKRLSVYAALLGVVISSKVLAVGLDDIESKPIERTVFFGRDWVQMPHDIQAKFQAQKSFMQRYPDEHLIGFWTNRKTRTNLVITEKANKLSAPVLDLSSVSAEDVKKYDEELYQSLLVYFKSQMPSEYQGKLNLHFAKSIYLKQGNYCYQEHLSAPGKNGKIFHSTEIVCKNSAKYLQIKLVQITKPLSESQCSDLQSLAKYYLGG